LTLVDHAVNASINNVTWWCYNSYWRTRLRSDVGTSDLSEFFIFQQDSAPQHKALDANNLFQPLPNVELFQKFFQGKFSSKFDNLYSPKTQSVAHK